MGIRYYAYAYDAALTQRAIDNPRSILSSDPLADAWGMTPHVAVGYATFEQVSEERDMLYLDKAWRGLQELTEARDPGAPPRPAFRMFEGDVRHHSRGWDSWVRVIHPTDVPAILDDLESMCVSPIEDGAVRPRYGAAPEDERAYVESYLHKARAFVAGLVSDGRGMVYTIG